MAWQAIRRNVLKSFLLSQKSQEAMCSI